MLARSRFRKGAEMVIVEGAGIARHELVDLVDAVVWGSSKLRGLVTLASAD